jgi:hypothetical protein
VARLLRLPGRPDNLGRTVFTISRAQRTLASPPNFTLLVTMNPVHVTSGYDSRTGTVLLPSVTENLVGKSKCTKT